MVTYNRIRTSPIWFNQLERCSSSQSGRLCLTAALISLFWSIPNLFLAFSKCLLVSLV